MWLGCWLTCDSHGFYAVIVDNGPIEYLDGYPARQSEFQTPLFESKGLDGGAHQILIVNENQYNATQPDNKCKCQSIRGHS